MRRKRKGRGIGLARKSVLFLNLVFVVLILLSYLSSITSPSVLWPLAFLGLAYPFFLCIHIAFIIFWILSKPVYALISMMTVIIGWKFLTGTIGFRESNAIEVPKTSRDMIRVMTWNVHEFKPFDLKNNRPVRDQMLEVIRNEKPDILCLQEYYSKRRGESNIKRLITEILDADHYHVYEEFSNPWELKGMVIFSRIPFTDTGSVKFPNSNGGNEAIYADFKYKKKKFRVYNIHLQSISFKPEDYEYIKTVKDEINTDVESSRRIGSRLKRAFIKRSEQVIILSRHMKDYPNSLVVTGDFNDTPTSFAVNKLSYELKNAFREKGSGFGMTYNGEFPNFQIDYILVSKDFQVKSYLTVNKKLSDHYPVRSDLELTP
ncbi:endonuclease/exonuclease/phosphatase family protein [Arcticibacter eurypsychrophilus]|uniref:endonuclease/exonuclease/phosphatase family protein n=1 Tax=Arcticibacter eurypsychrophilus TaxID=1434752 RepID=UPI00084CF207|nr:endonuclease/exonuclease/phosphatase family protein [Arcticibacter eurypsychrophilus]